MGGCSYPIYPAKAVFRKHSSRIVIPSEAEGFFSLAIRGSVPDSEKWETLYRRKGGDGASPKRLSEGGGKSETKKISRCARNDSVGNGYLVHHTKNMWETRSSRIVIPSGAEGSFSLAARGRVFGSEKRETPYRGKTVGGASYKRLGEGGGKRALSLIPK